MPPTVLRRRTTAQQMAAHQTQMVPARAPAPIGHLGNQIARNQMKMTKLKRQSSYQSRRLRKKRRGGKDKRKVSVVMTMTNSTWASALRNSRRATLPRQHATMTLTILILVIWAVRIRRRRRASRRTCSISTWAAQTRSVCQRSLACRHNNRALT